MKYLSWDENRPCVLTCHCFANVNWDNRAERDR
jgi:hypothetical protein